MSKSKGKGAYLGLGLPWIVNLVLCFFLGWPLGIIERLVRGNIIMAILNIFFGFIFWVIDLVSFILHKDMKWLA
ncbi:MAG: hypothetical protein FWE16_00110 [Firmicutes bacterium]|nr:hypothetical protein [Bacillota bacterium]